MAERKTKVHKILFVAANPSSAARLAVDEEFRRLQETIRGAKLRDLLVLELQPAARPDDLQQALLETRPTIVHFSGHGISGQGIVLQGGTEDEQKLVSGDALRHMFRTLKEGIRIVILNACNSIEQARAISDVIDFVVGMRGSLNDPAALTFASAFYRGLGFGETIQTAFDLGIGAIKLQGYDGEDVPDLLIRKGVATATLETLDRRAGRSVVKSRTSHGSRREKENALALWRQNGPERRSPEEERLVAELVKQSFRSFLETGQWLNLEQINQDWKRSGRRTDVYKLFQNIHSIAAIDRTLGRPFLQVTLEGARTYDGDHPLFNLVLHVVKLAAEKWYEYSGTGDKPIIEESELSGICSACNYQPQPGMRQLVSQFCMRLSPGGGSYSNEPFSVRPPMETMIYMAANSLDELQQLRKDLDSPASPDDVLDVLEQIVDYWLTEYSWPDRERFVLKRRDDALRILRSLRTMPHALIRHHNRQLIGGLDSALLGCGDRNDLLEEVTRLVGESAKLDVPSRQHVSLHEMAIRTGIDEQRLVALADLYEPSLGIHGQRDNEGNFFFHANEAALEYFGVASPEGLQSRYREAVQTESESLGRLSFQPMMVKDRFEVRSREKKLRLIERCLHEPPTSFC